jgi:hypothetical protein
VPRIHSRISSSSEPFPYHPLLLSLSIASSSGTRRPAGVSCGSTRRILTLFYFSTNFPTWPLGQGFASQGRSAPHTKAAPGLSRSEIELG